MGVEVMCRVRAKVVLGDFDEHHFGDVGGHRRAVHGGMVATVGDAVMGRALVPAIGFAQSFATIGLSVEYPGLPVGDRAIASERDIRRGRSLALAEAKVRDQDEGATMQCCAYGSPWLRS